MRIGVMAVIMATQPHHDMKQARLQERGASIPQRGRVCGGIAAGVAFCHALIPGMRR